ncbi:adenylate/guanylate cyclase domain-containing protein [Polaromonas sp.]|uniref:adenylate/guanylate cyclase domain-containing protein n=1 Tax=Polaromonas sp. TaxID=1869339 RepID=UPI003262DEC4
MIELPAAMTRNTKVLLVMDVVESVRIMEQDQDGFVRRWQQLVEEAEQNVLPLHGGRIVKSLGDGLMLEFADAQTCVKAAFAIQYFSEAANQDVAPSLQMHLRMGGHVASFVTDQHDIYGTDVNLTARFCTLAGPSDIVISAELRDRLVPSLDADIEDMGECYLKHVEEPIHAYRIAPPGRIPVMISPPADVTELRPTIAVIPFTARTSGPDDSVLGEILAEEIIAALSRTPDLNVISRLSTTSLRGRDTSLPELQNHLKANYVLSGAYRVAGSQLILVTELIEARTGRVVWGESLRSTVQEVLRGEDRITSEVVAQLGAHVVHTEMQRAASRPLPNLESSTLLLGAISLMHRSTRSEFDRVREMLEYLIDRHRRLPTPRAWLAKWHVLQVTRGLSSGGKDETKRALEQTQRALDVDPSCSLALAIEGFVHCHMLKDLDGAAQRYELALAANPNDSLAWLFSGVLHAFQGVGYPAKAAAEKALSLSPLDPMLYFYQSLAASAVLASGDYESAIALAKASLRANKAHSSTYRALTIALSLNRQTDEAKDTAQQLLTIEPNFNVREFIRRSPSEHYPAGQIYAQALRDAGVPE